LVAIQGGRDARAPVKGLIQVKTAVGDRMKRHKAACQQVMIPTPGNLPIAMGWGPSIYYTGETVVLFRPHKRRKEIVELLQALLAEHPEGGRSRGGLIDSRMLSRSSEQLSHMGVEPTMLRQQPRFAACLPWRQPIEIDQETLGHLVNGRILAVSTESLVAAAPQRFQGIEVRTTSRQPQQLNAQLGGQPLRGAGDMRAVMS